MVYHTFWQEMALPARLGEAGPPARHISAAKSFPTKQVAGSPPAILDIRAGLGSQRRFVMRDIFWQSRTMGPLALLGALPMLEFALCRFFQCPKRLGWESFIAII